MTSERKIELLRFAFKEADKYFQRPELTAREYANFVGNTIARMLEAGAQPTFVTLEEAREFSAALLSGELDQEGSCQQDRTAPAQKGYGDFGTVRAARRREAQRSR